MPKTAIAESTPDLIIPLDEIGLVLRDIFMKKPNLFI